MPHYFTFDDLTAVIPADFATQALDDDGDGVAEMFDAVAGAAEDAVNAYLEQRYAVPLTGSIPAVVKRTAVLLCAEACFARREVSERFTHKRELMSRMKTLEGIRDGSTQLTPGRKSKRGRGAVIYEASRTHGSGRLGS